MDVDIQTAVQRSTAKKTMFRIVPIVLTMYFICYLDRVNISYAALEMNSDIGLSEAAYGFGAGIFFVAYVACQVPANILMFKVGPRRWMGVILMAWGTFALLMFTITSPVHFYILRVLLGIAEAGFFPALVFFISTWFPISHRGRVTAMAISAAPISGLLGGPLTTWLMEATHGTAGLHGWQMMFIIEALPAIALGIWVFVRLPQTAHGVNWLTREEADWLTETLESEHTAVQSVQKPRGVLRTLVSPLVLCLGFVYLGVEFGEYAFGFFLPLMVESLNTQHGLGLTISQVGLVAAIPSLCGALGMILWGRHSDRNQERTWHIILPLLVGAVAIVLTSFASNLPVAIVGFGITAVAIFSTVGVFWTVPSQYLTGVAAAAGIALINAMGSFAGVLGPMITGSLQTATGNYNASLWAIAGFLIIASTAMLILRRVKTRDTATSDTPRDC